MATSGSLPERNDFLRDDARDANQQSFYAVKEPFILSGWYLDFPKAGERSLGQTALLGGGNLDLYEVHPFLGGLHIRGDDPP